MANLQMYFSHVHHLHLGANHISVSIPDNVYPLVFQNFSISYLMNTSYDTDKNSYLSPKTNSPAILREYDTFFCFVSYNTFESALTARRSNQSILKEINPKYLLEGLMLKLKLQCFGHLMQKANSLEKTLMLGKIEGKRKRGQQRMRWLSRVTNSTNSMDTRSEQTPGDSDLQRGPGVLQSMGLKRTRHDSATELWQQQQQQEQLLLGTEIVVTNFVMPVPQIIACKFYLWNILWNVRVRISGHTAPIYLATVVMLSTEKALNTFCELKLDKTRFCSLPLSPVCVECFFLFYFFKY